MSGCLFLGDTKTPGVVWVLLPHGTEANLEELKAKFVGAEEVEGLKNALRLGSSEGGLPFGEEVRAPPKMEFQGQEGGTEEAGFVASVRQPQSGLGEHEFDHWARIMCENSGLLGGLTVAVGKPKSKSKDKGELISRFSVKSRNLVALVEKLDRCPFLVVTDELFARHLADEMYGKAALRDKKTQVEVDDLILVVNDPLEYLFSTSADVNILGMCGLFEDEEIESKNKGILEAMEWAQKHKVPVVVTRQAEPELWPEAGVLSSALKHRRASVKVEKGVKARMAGKAAVLCAPRIGNDIAGSNFFSSLKPFGTRETLVLVGGGAGSTMIPLAMEAGNRGFRVLVIRNLCSELTLTDSHGKAVSDRLAPDRELLNSGLHVLAHQTRMFETLGNLLAHLNVE